MRAALLNLHLNTHKYTRTRSDFAASDCCCAVRVVCTYADKRERTHSACTALSACKMPEMRECANKTLRFCCQSDA